MLFVKQLTQFIKSTQKYIMKTNFYKAFLLHAMVACTLSTQAQWTKVSSNGAADLVVHNNTIYSSTGFKSSDGSNWTSMTNFNGGNCLTVYENTLFSGGNGSTFYKSTDDGATWTMVSGRSGLTSVTMTSIYKDGSNYVYGTTGGGKWQYSTDNGSNWSGSDIVWGVSVGNIGPDFVKLNNVLYSCAYSNVFKSTDNGKNWDTTRAFGQTNSICAQGTDLYCAGYGSGVFKSSDAGASWTCKLGCAPTSTEKSSARVISSGTSIFVGGALGKVNQSTDGGDSWINLSGDGTVLGTTELVADLAVFNNQLYASTAQGIYRRDISGGTTSVDKLEDNLTLSVYPNPVQNDVSISVNNVLTINSVTIKNLQGQQVYSGSNIQNNAKLDISTLSQGIYFIEVVSNDKTAIKKVIK